MIAIPKGTKDVLPEQSYRWHYIEEKIRKVVRLFNIKEIRTPTFEHTELFLRGVGETTDVVSKEMYTFLDKGNRSITLKPEGTAGVGRAYIENNLNQNPQPTKMYYLTSVFRYERPQSGRLREHHQFGVELYGADSAHADVEAISVAYTLFNELGIENLELNINSIGCPKCREGYNTALREYFALKIEKMCPTCSERLEKNPLRILDCKNTVCADFSITAPKMIDYQCAECENHHQELKKLLEIIGIDFKVNPMIVRGLDYYTKTVFEFISTSIGAQGTVCGGGRYNNLVEEIGGQSTGAVGFGMGLERLIMVMENNNIKFCGPPKSEVYIASLSSAEADYAFKIADSLRKAGISADSDLLDRSLKAQMKYANKMGYTFVIVIGSEEIAKGIVTLKNMLNKEEKQVSTDKIAEALRETV